jgi:hypothetical protein
MARSRKPDTPIARPLAADALRVVLDTNTIYGRRYRLDGPHIAILERAIVLGRLVLIVPQIVLEETENKYREDVSKLQQTISAEVEKLNVLLPPERRCKFGPLEFDAAVADFAERFRKRLTELQAQHPAYSDISHEDVVRRDLERRRPFQESGRGYRDSLIWETVLRKVASDRLTVLLTENTKDFCAKDGNLHPHLVKDLEARGLRSDAMKVCTTLEAFVDQYLKPLLPTNGEILMLIQSDRYRPFSFQEFFATNRDAIRKQLNKQSERIASCIHADLENLEVVYQEDPSTVQIVEAYELDSERLFLAYDIVADINLEFFVFKSDYYSMSDEIQIDIRDIDWNEHYIWAGKDVTLPLRFSLELRLGKGSSDTVESFDVEVREFYGWCWSCSAPIQSDAAESCSKCGANLLAPRRTSR